MRHDKTAELTRHKRIISPFKHHPASSSPLLFFSNCLPLKQLHQSTQIVYLRNHDDHCFGHNPTENTWKIIYIPRAEWIQGGIIASFSNLEIEKHLG